MCDLRENAEAKIRSGVEKSIILNVADASSIFFLDFSRTERERKNLISSRRVEIAVARRKKITKGVVRNCEAREREKSLGLMRERVGGGGGGSKFFNNHLIG